MDSVELSHDRHWRMLITHLSQLPYHVTSHSSPITWPLTAPLSHDPSSTGLRKNDYLKTSENLKRKKLKLEIQGVRTASAPGCVSNIWQATLANNGCCLLLLLLFRFCLMWRLYVTVYVHTKHPHSSVNSISL